MTVLLLIGAVGGFVVGVLVFVLASAALGWFFWVPSVLVWLFLRACHLTPATFHRPWGYSKAYKATNSVYRFVTAPIRWATRLGERLGERGVRRLWPNAATRGAKPPAVGMPIEVFAATSETLLVTLVTDAAGEFDVPAEVVPTDGCRLRAAGHYWWDGTSFRATSWATAATLGTPGTSTVIEASIPTPGG